MIYNLSEQLQREQFKARCNQLFRDGRIVELTEKRGIRTLSQNSYLHLILSYFACQYGERMSYVKEYIFKGYVNRDTFLLKKTDKVLGNVLVLRSTSDLTTKELSNCIERFRNWSVMEAGIYIPEPNDDALIGEMQREVEKNKHFL